MLSYRMKRKELIFMLDCFGDVNGLYQGFGNIYIDRQQHAEIAAELHRKGMITYVNEKTVVDKIFSYIFKKIYEAEIILSDNTLGIWIYYSDNIIITIEADSLRTDDFIITPIKSSAEFSEKMTESGYSDSEFQTYMGGIHKYSFDEMLKLLPETRI